MQKLNCTDFQSKQNNVKHQLTLILVDDDKP